MHLIMDRHISMSYQEFHTFNKLTVLIIHSTLAKIITQTMASTTTTKPTLTKIKTT